MAQSGCCHINDGCSWSNTREKSFNLLVEDIEDVIDEIRFYHFYN